MHKDFDQIYELLDEHFEEYSWYDSSNRSLVILEDYSKEYDWGWLIELTTKEFILTNDPDKAPLGLKPLIVDLNRKLVVSLVDWPSNSIEELVSQYIKENNY